MSDLDSSRRKLARANEHLHALWRDLAVLTRQPTYRLRSEHNLETSEDPIWFDYFVKSLDPVPPRFSVLAGDAIGNMRSALDHAAWALIVRAHGESFAEQNARSIYFPICEDPKRFDNHFVTANLGAPAVTCLRGTQPFVHNQKDPRRDALWVLHELTNIDKHRALHLIVRMPFDARILTEPELPGGEILFIEKGPLYVGAHVIHFTAPRTVPQGTYVKVQCQATVEISIEKTPRGARTPLFIGLREIRKRTREALHAIRALPP